MLPDCKRPTQMKKTQVPLVLMVDYSIYVSSGGKTVQQRPKWVIVEEGEGNSSL